MDNCDAGHFIAAHGCGRDLLFDQFNCHAECKGCNGFDENHLHGYERGLIKRYGKELPQQLKQRYYEYEYSDKAIKDFRREEYSAMIKQLPSYQHILNTSQ